MAAAARKARPRLIAAGNLAAEKGESPAWWESRVFAAAMIVAALVPLIAPPIPPLVDMMGHMGRYKIALDLADSPTLSQWYEFHWLPIGNLGVDLLVVPLARLIGVELAAKLIVMLIPPLTVAGMLLIATEVHGRLPPTTAFAVPLAFGHPFMFGFVNFSLSMAMALLAFGLWLKLGRQGRHRFRLLLFVPISFAIYFAHAFGWGTLGLLCFTAQLMAYRKQGRGWLDSILRACREAATLGGPLLLIFLWRSGASGSETGDWFLLDVKLKWLAMALRDRWKLYDIAGLTVLLVVIMAAIREPHLSISRRLGAAALILTLCFLCMPRIVFGSAYADMRLVPYLLAIWLLAIRPDPGTNRRLSQRWAIAAMIFALVRIVGSTVSLGLEGIHQSKRLEAVDHIPYDARVATLVWDKCVRWRLNRNTHFGSMATIRKEAFSNDQWPLAGSSLLTVHYPAAGPFEFDPSQIVLDGGCPDRGWSIQNAFAVLPRGAFDYLWLIDVPPIPPARLEGWARVWASDNSVLLKRVDAAVGASRKGPVVATDRTASGRFE